MEHLKNNGLESPREEFGQLSGKEKLEAILSLFGTNLAREAFIKICERYIEARDKAIHESYSDDTYIRRRAINSSPKQAVIHNRIMDTLTRLASQTQTISPLQNEVLRKMADRDITAQSIREYVASKGKVNANEEDEPEQRKKGMSDTAYYHSLGKEH